MLSNTVHMINGFLRTVLVVVGSLHIIILSDPIGSIPSIPLTACYSPCFVPGSRNKSTRDVKNES